MSYTVLARRYRPETFDDVIGQEAISRTLTNAITMDRVAHAYLFSGTRGVGKTTMARVLAKALNCLASDGPTTTPCCKCESCVAISSGDDIDVLEIDGASNTGVEHIRELRQNAIYRPARSRFKIYIIDEVHMLSTSAFNALLKTLEEPPEHVKFIFATTEPNRILPTILSRCQRFDFRNIQLSRIADQLQSVLKGESVEADEALVRRVARLANGSMRDGLSLLDQLLSMTKGELTLDLLNDLLGTPQCEQIVDLAQAIGSGDLAGALREVDAALGQGLALEQLADALQAHFRDLMVLRNCGPETELVDMPDQQTRDRFQQQAKAFDDAALVYNITVMEELRRAIKSSGSGRALFEAAIVRLTAGERFSDTKALLQQLQQFAASGSVASSNPAPPNRQAAAGTMGNPAATSNPGNAHATAADTRNNTVPVAATANNTRAVAAPATPGPVSTSTNTAEGQSSIPAATPSANAALSPPSELTLEYLQTQWSPIIAAVGDQNTTRHLKMSLQNTQPRDWQNGVLTLSYDPTAGATKMVAERPGGPEEIAKALNAVLGQAISVTLVQSDYSEPTADTRSSEPEAQAAYESPADIPGAKPNQKQINAAINDPNVKEVQRVLGGRVKSIKKRGK